MPFQIIRNDITKVRADAIVNTANPNPVYGSGTDTAVYRAAGEKRLLAARRKIGDIAPGEAAVTKAFALPARYIIHTVGPAWVDGSHGEYDTLAACYRKSLLLAEQLRCKSIAFPLISTGVYGFPKQEALRIALRTIEAFLDHSEMDVTLVVFDRRAFDLSSRLVSDVAQYIDERYAEEHHKLEHMSGASAPVEGSRRDRRSPIRRRQEDRLQQAEPMEALEDTSSANDWMADAAMPPPAVQRPPMAPSVAGRSLSELMEQVGESFQQRLLRLIDERGLTDAWVYKRANVDRKLFSKIRRNAAYRPGKRTAVALAIALELNLDETIDLLGRAELALSPSSKFDLIIEYCILNRIYDIFEINALLFQYDQPLLGC
jgi:O-acetyl-ADP-ribose deacetylase (regulator of RNase III)